MAQPVTWHQFDGAILYSTQDILHCCKINPEKRTLQVLWPLYVAMSLIDKGKTENSLHDEAQFDKAFPI